MSDSVRVKVRDMFQEYGVLNCDLLEKGVYNETISRAKNKGIQASWNNWRFMQMYTDKARSMLTYVCPESYAYCEELANAIRNDPNPQTWCFKKPTELRPDLWKSLVDAKKERDVATSADSAVSKTNQFVCKRCKKRECAYYELQTRSADESMTIFVTCLNCGNRWRIG